MFNIQGSELIFLLLIALIVLGPEKLPDAIRKFGRAYAEFKKMANGFQGELREALDEPMRELRETSDMMRAAVNFSDEDGAAPTAAPDASAAPPPKREQGLNFGSANPRRSAATSGDAEGSPPADEAAPAAPQREPGLNFGSANPTRTKPARDPLAPVAPPPVAGSDEPDDIANPDDIASSNAAASSDAAVSSDDDAPAREDAAE